MDTTMGIAHDHLLKSKLESTFLELHSSTGYESAIILEIWEDGILFLTQHRGTFDGIKYLRSTELSSIKSGTTYTEFEGRDSHNARGALAALSLPAFRSLDAFLSEVIARKAPLYVSHSMGHSYYGRLIEFDESALLIEEANSATLTFNGFTTFKRDAVASIIAFGPDESRLISAALN